MQRTPDQIITIEEITMREGIAMRHFVTNPVFYRAGIYGTVGLLGLLLAACGGGGGGSSTAATTYSVTAIAGSGGTISPTIATVNSGETVTLTVTPEADYGIDNVSGCGGTLSGNSYTTGAVSADCAVTASFVVVVAPAMPIVNLGYGIKQLQFSWGTVDGATHYQLLEDADGSSGYTQVGGDLTATAVNHDIFLPQRLNARYQVNACNSVGCTASDVVYAQLGNKLFEAIGYAKASNTEASDYFGYAVSLSDDGNTLAVGAYGDDSAGGGETDDCGLTVTSNCALDSGAVYLIGRDGVGNWSQLVYLKAITPRTYDWFGLAVALAGDGNTLAVGAPQKEFGTTLNTGGVYLFTRDTVSGVWSQHSIQQPALGAEDRAGMSVALSTDGRTLAVSAPFEDSSATTIDGDATDNSAADSGAVYILSLGDTGWVKQAYIKSSENFDGDRFGTDVALSGDGNTLAVGAPYQDTVATDAGLVFIFGRDGATWSEINRIFVSDNRDDRFGERLALSADGSTLAVGSRLEDSNATTIDGDGSNDSAADAGAAYIFVANATSGWANWSQQAYIKASNTEAGDWFGSNLALSADGNTLVVGANSEDSGATGIDGDQASGTESESGAVYLYSRDATTSTWSAKSYIKASNTDLGDYFGGALALSADGNTLVVRSSMEDSSATGICTSGDAACATAQAKEDATSAGAVYLY
jgi:hypothetical protein